MWDERDLIISLGNKNKELEEENERIKEICYELFDWLGLSKDILEDHRMTATKIHQEFVYKCLKTQLGIKDEAFENYKICNRDRCKGCEKFGWIYGAGNGGYYTCNMMNRKVENPLYSHKGAERITPKMFLKSEIIFREKEDIYGD